MGTFKEIVTKTVIGKAKKLFKDTYKVEPDEAPSLVLGCWVINHVFKGEEKNEAIKLSGSFDVNIWYSHDDNTKTKVFTKTITYEDLVKVKLKSDSEFNSNSEILVRSLKQPSCINIEIKDGEICFDIEKELGIEVVGDTKIKILVEDEDDDWDIIEPETEEVSEEVLKEIDEEVTEDFIK